MTKAQMKPNPRMASPFTGKDLLDQTYGVADRYAQVIVPCACGAVQYLVDERRRPYCPACFPGANDNWLTVSEEDLGPVGPVIKLSGNGKRSRKFEFFAGGWFELDSQLDRLPNQVKKPSLLAELNRRARFSKPLPEMKSTPRPYTRYVRTASGYLREYPSIDLPECSCADEDMHEHYVLSALGGVCAQHGLSCGTCGEIH